MLTIALILVQLLSTTAGIYIFDYIPDNSINSPLVIILSIIVGLLIMLITLYIYIELLYVLLAKNTETSNIKKHKIAKQMISIPLHLTNVRIKVIGLENLPENKGFSIYSNHTSMMDIPVLMYKLYDYPVAFLAKELTGRVFSIGKWATNLGCILIDRSNARKGAESIIKVIRNIKSGSTMVLFPEGTRNPDHSTLIPFKDGAFKAALKSKRPLVPISIVKKKGYSNTIWPLPRRVTVVIHKPLLFDEYKALKTNELSDKVKVIIESSLIK